MESECINGSLYFEDDDIIEGIYRCLSINYAFTWFRWLTEDFFFDKITFFQNFWILKAYLNKKVLNRWIKRNGHLLTAAHSPDVSQRKFFGGLTKFMTCDAPIEFTTDLKGSIRAEIYRKNAETLRKVWSNMKLRQNYFSLQNGRHTENFSTSKLRTCRCLLTSERSSKNLEPHHRKQKNLERFWNTMYIY